MPGGEPPLLAPSGSRGCRCRAAVDPRSQYVWRWLGCVFLLVLLLITCVVQDKELAVVTTADSYTVTYSNYIGDASFALTGSLAAGMEGMDLLGCVIVGIITALGGGTFRDTMLGRTPIFWLSNWDELVLSIIVAGSTFFLWPRLSRKFQLTSADEWLFYTDTLGLAVFAANGAYIANSLDVRPHFMGCAACGMFTATFGGLTRDVLLGRPPRILYSHCELYAVPAFFGGCVTTAVTRLIVGSDAAAMKSVLAGTVATAFARVYSYNYGTRLPTFPAEDVFSLAARPRDAAAVIAKREQEEALSMRLSELHNGESGLSQAG
eukprot:CAMPEP_0194490060 /NCGR_PEP_ID=MMETSP0253-20130528/9409_1 /TAXON_ID=2966 /ORGANISM="Noctiluca scintillans" /LENGTH=320 /DNA_ID=CAMNT_0039330643 /DNA_START=40 /DNA_END=999 /DNA_ORIENTATION=+